MNRVVVLVVLFMLTGCAAVTGPEFTQHDKDVITPYETEYENCLADIATDMNGSDDVAPLVKHVTSLCDPLLEPIDEYLANRGFSEAYISGVMDTQRERGRRIVTFFLQRE